MRSNHGWTALIVFVLLAAAPLGLAACGAGGSATATAPQPAAASQPAPTRTPSPPAANVSPSPAAATPSASPTAEPAASPTATSSPAATTVEVRISDFRFDPPTITVAAGTAVVWTNLGPTAHTTTSKQGVWDSTVLLKGQSFRFTFRQPGTYPYWCSLHPEMLGTVVVE